MFGWVICVTGLPQTKGLTGRRVLSAAAVVPDVSLSVSRCFKIKRFGVNSFSCAAQPYGVTAGGGREGRGKGKGETPTTNTQFINHYLMIYE